MRYDYDGTPITDKGPRCIHCDRDRVDGEEVCIRHYQGPTPSAASVPTNENP